MALIRKALLLLLLCATATLSYGQTFAEWFSQKKTQIKYLTQQIAALAQYGAYVKQGYDLSQQGLGSIGGWVKGEFDLHNSYYTSLRTVNPLIKNNPKADRIVRMAQQIPGEFDQLAHWSLAVETRTYINSVKSSVLAGADKDLAELQTILSGQVAMTDDERLKRLDGIYANVSDKLVFTRSFCNEVRVLVNHRQQELQDTQTQQSIYENN